MKDLPEILWKKYIENQQTLLWLIFCSFFARFRSVLFRRLRHWSENSRQLVRNSSDRFRFAVSERLLAVSAKISVTSIDLNLRQSFCGTWKQKEELIVDRWPLTVPSPHLPLSPLPPLHLSPSLANIASCYKMFPKVPIYLKLVKARACEKEFSQYGFNRYSSLCSAGNCFDSGNHGFPSGNRTVQVVSRYQLATARCLPDRTNLDRRQLLPQWGRLFVVNEMRMQGQAFFID